MSENGERMDSEQEQPTSQQHASTPGAVLAASREAMGLTVEQVADQLKLAPRQVAAIEQADYAALPNMAVTRGFIRAYAKVVRLDPAPLVAMVEVEAAEGHATATVRPTNMKASFTESRFPTLAERNSGKPMGAIIAGVGVVAMLGIAAAWQAGLLKPSMFGGRDAAAPATEIAAPASSVPLVVTQPGSQPAADAALQSPSVPLISVPPPAGNSSGPATVPGMGVPAEQGAAPAAPAATAPATTPAATAPAAAAPVAPAATPAAPADAAGNGKLVLTLKADSWIEIRRPGQKALIARLVKAGSTESFDVREKDLLIVGNPRAVNASLRGAPLELPQVANGTISRVNIK